MEAVTVEARVGRGIMSVLSVCVGGEEGTGGGVPAEKGTTELKGVYWRASSTSMGGSRGRPRGRYSFPFIASVSSRLV